MYSQVTPFTHQPLQLEQYTTPRMSLPTTPYLEPSPQPKLSPMIIPTQHPLQVRMYAETSQQSSSQIINSGQHFGNHVVQQSSRQDDPYRCNFLGQLAGSYEIQTPSGVDNLSVIVPDATEIDKPYAIVRRVCDDGEALPDQFIYEEQVCFSLCSTEREVYGWLPKGINMKYSVKWNLKSGGQVIWRRTKEVIFSLVSVDSLSCCSRRNSINSMYSTTSTSCVSHTIDTQDRDGVRNLIRPELRQMCKPQVHPVYESRGTSVSHNDKPNYPQEDTQGARSSHFANTVMEKNEFGAESTRSYESGGASSQQVVSSKLSEDKLFAQIKTECLRCPSLLKRLISWASSNSSRQPITREFNRDVSVGRLWVTAKSGTDCSGLPAQELEENLQDALDDIKGAYQEVETGIWKQPIPQVGEPGLQHRLLRDCQGFWMIQERVIEEGESDEKWVACARELSEERWVDLKNDQREIEVRLVEMVAILEKMMQEQTAVESADVQKSYVEFLFKTCNQKKLNTKLKKRNLKHNIANLKVKLDKQYALSFAVKVATTAEAIVQELGE